MDAKEWIDKHESEFIHDICELIKIPSISKKSRILGMPFGKDCFAALEKSLEIAKRMGFKTFNHEGYCGTLLWQGSGENEIGLFGHTDVVPVGNDWSYAPFEPVVKDGMIIGRGASDNKGSFMSALYALFYLKESGYAPKNNFRFFFGCNEENGMEDIEYYVRHHKEPCFSIVPDVDFPVCNGEKGILEIETACKAQSKVLKNFSSGIMKNAVPAQASALLAISKKESEVLAKNDCKIEKKGDGIYKVSTNGIAAHAAFPEGSQSAEVKLAKILLEAEVLDFSAENLMEAICGFFSDYYGAGLGIQYEDTISGKLTHVGSMAEYDGQVFRQSINIRYNVTADYDKMLGNIKKRIKEFDFFIEKIHNNKPCFIDPDSEQVKSLIKICSKYLQKKYTPYVMGGGTYARKLKHAVGFGPGIPGKIKIFGEQRGSAHQADEYVEIAHLKQAFLIYIDALKELDTILYNEKIID